METAILLSLVGVRSLLSNQWTNSVQNNLDKVVSVVKGSYSTCSIIRYSNDCVLQVCYLRD